MLLLILHFNFIDFSIYFWGQLDFSYYLPTYLRECHLYEEKKKTTARSYVLPFLALLYCLVLCLTQLQKAFTKDYHLQVSSIPNNSSY